MSIGRRSDRGSMRRNPYVSEQQTLAVEWKQRTTTIPDAAREPGINRRDGVLEGSSRQRTRVDVPPSDRYWPRSRQYRVPRHSEWCTTGAPLETIVNHGNDERPGQTGSF